MADADPTITTETADLAAIDEDSAHEIDVLLAKHKIPRATVEELRSKFQRLYLLVDAPIIFKPLRGDQFDRVMQKPDKDRGKALKEMASFLVVYPAPEAYQALLSDFPLIWSTVADAAAAIASAKATSEAKKL